MKKVIALVFVSFYAVAAKGQSSTPAEKEAAGIKYLEARDYVHAAPLLREAADAGLPKSQYNYAVCLLEGVGTAKNEAAANVYLRKAAEQDDVDAQYKLAHSYRTGRGIAIHLDSAFYWYRRAAALGDLDAGWNVGMSYMNGDGVARDTAEGAHWLEMIALREPDAPDTIPGTMLVNGQPQDDPRLAFSPQGQDILQDRIELMQMRLTGQFLSMDSTNAFVWALIANELKAEMPGSDQLQFNDFIEKLELALSPAIVASAKSEAERLLKRPLRHFDARTKLVLDR